MSDLPEALAMIDFLSSAKRVAIEAHGDQKRKYTGEPYWYHPRAVAGLVTTFGGPIWLRGAAWLHDVVEDTDTTLDDLKAFGFHPLAIEAVDYMTERATEGNRAARKQAECERLAKGDRWCQLLKVADLIDNTPSILEHDSRFAPVYLAEVRALHQALDRAPDAARRRLADLLDGHGLTELDVPRLPLSAQCATLSGVNERHDANMQTKTARAITAIGHTTWRILIPDPDTPEVTDQVTGEAWLYDRLFLDTPEVRDAWWVVLGIIDTMGRQEHTIRDLDQITRWDTTRPMIQRDLLARIEAAEQAGTGTPADPFQGLTQ